MFMLISVVVPALNEEKRIEAVLKSVRSQNTRHSIELIVGDGCSEDRTVEIAKRYADRVVKEKRRSAAWQRQAGANAAKGEVIAFADADSVLPGDWAEKIGNEFLNDKGLVAVYSSAYFNDVPRLESKVTGFLFSLYMLLAYLSGFDNPTGQNLAVRRSAFGKIGGFNTSLKTCEDVDLVRRIKNLGKVKFLWGNAAGVSGRRVKKTGYLGYALFHVRNFFRYLRKGTSNGNYEDLR
ncbi:Glycosyltransferase AglG [uncultured archaeon]|nr:Glycosyltransferase AglG [uncultured archaeon]